MTTELPTIHDVLIIGAGPCGLAVAARLREKTPSAIFTDEEHQRYHWINRHSAKAAIKSRKTGKVREARSSDFMDSPSMLVLDSSGDHWMSKWNRLFDELKIRHLRSPMFFHPDPHDRDGLQAFVHEKGRECECIEIANCVGKEFSKHQLKKKRKKLGNLPARPVVTIDERDRKDYWAPPTDLFREYCHYVAERYGLLDGSLIKQGTVQDIDYGVVPQLDPLKSFFTVKTGTENHYARSVVLAVGAGNRPIIPTPFPVSGCECACHVFQSMEDTLPPHIAASKRANVLVIGGGLTSAQVVDRAIKQGASKVWHIMRGSLKVKPFDVDLGWMGKFKNHEKASFWAADTDAERINLIKSARGGGSITPRYFKILQQHHATGKSSLHTNVKVLSQHWNEQKKTWSIQTEPVIEGLPEFEYIYFATGVQSDIEKLSFMQTMLRKYPVECFDGIPALTDDLMWLDQVPLFAAGKFASLRLGPGAGNLEGARTGAERIAWAVEDVLRDKEDEIGAYRTPHSAEVDDLEQNILRYRIGLGSRYEALTAVES